MRDRVIPVMGGGARRRLGSQGLEVRAPGLGCWSMSGSYGPADDAESIATLRYAVDRRCTFFDTAEAYGPYTNEELLGRALAGRREECVIATKFGIDLEGSDGRGGLDSREAHIRATVEGSLRRLGTDHVDLLYQHRVDPLVPIEDVAGAVGGLIEAGKVRYFGLCEAKEETIRRAHATFPLSAVQVEYSLWERGVERSVLPVLRELDIGLVAYSPLGRGFLAGDALPAGQYPEGDYRRLDPRFAPGCYEENQARTAVLRHVAASLNVAPAQLAIAWLLHQGPDIVPIPGTKRTSRLEQNLAAADLVLASDTLDVLGDPSSLAAGARYPDWLMETIE